MFRHKRHTSFSQKPCPQGAAQNRHGARRSELRLEKEAEPTATTKKAIETVICGSRVGIAGAKHGPKRVFYG